MNWTGRGARWKAEEKRGPYRVCADIGRSRKSDRASEPFWFTAVVVRPDGWCVHVPNRTQGGTASSRAEAEERIEARATEAIDWDKRCGPPIPPPPSPEAVERGQEIVREAILHLGAAQSAILRLKQTPHLHVAARDIEGALKVLRQHRADGDLDLSRLFVKELGTPE